MDELHQRQLRLQHTISAVTLTLTAVGVSAQNEPKSQSAQQRRDAVGAMRPYTEDCVVFDISPPCAIKWPN